MSTVAAVVDPILLARRRALARARGRRRLALLGGIVGLAAAVGGYQGLRATPIFDVHAVAVHGGDPALDAEVQTAMQAAVGGRSLIGLDTGPLERRLQAMPYVKAVRVDRAFPNTLAVSIVPERPVVTARSGHARFAVSADGRILGPASPKARGLAAVTLPAGVAMPVGRPTANGDLRAALRLLSATPAWFRHRVGRVIRIVPSQGSAVLVVNGGLQVRLGDAGRLGVKLQVAARVLAVMPHRDRHSLAYVDVSAPGRPALGYRH
jgi:cell division septal protein FtsQ